MKKLNKLLAIILAVAMIMSLAVVVQATDYIITINDSVDGYTYYAYQIFAGTYGATENTLGNIIWGTGIDSSRIDDLMSALKALTLDNSVSYPFGTCSDAADVAEVLAREQDDSALAQLFAKTVAEYLSSTGFKQATTASGEGCVIDTEAAGYYLVMNSDNGIPDYNSAYTRYILEVVGPTTVDEPKRNIPTSDKTVTETDDSNAAETEVGVTADYDIGDNVPFTPTATLPDNYASYDEYALTFHDTLSIGLSFVSSSLDVTVYIPFVADSTTYPSGYTVSKYEDGVYTVIPDTDSLTVGTTYYYTYVVDDTTYTLAYVGGTTEPQDSCSFEVQIEDTHDLTSNSVSIPVDKTAIIVVNYMAELNSSAVVGGTTSTGNTNEMYITYSNNPNDTGTGKTTTTKTTVFTYELNVSKTKADGTTALSGAVFQLYKMYTLSANAFDSSVTYYTYNSNTRTYTEVDQTATPSPNPEIDYYYFDTVGNPQAATEVSGSYTYSWSGLDDGVYMLKETTTPSGYNTMDDMYFSIEATIAETSQTGVYEITALDMYEATYNDNGSDADTLVVSDDEKYNAAGGDFTASTSDGELTGVIKNSSGSELPATGGIGTTIFYVVGGVLVLGAIVLLITKKRLGNEEK
ncbi:MAG: LPXTG cell wall anchor domain-containing protein [Oscillospiraceae bacterium]|nr:LPXTG cell wall anchor domain-containing protein [Oscillospiraceae bacterium]